MILEKDGKLCALYNRSELACMRPTSRNVFEFDSSTKRAGGRFVFLRDARGRVNQFRTGHMFFKRKPLGPEEGASQLKVDPVRPVPVMIKEALKAEPQPKPVIFCRRISLNSENSIENQARYSLRNH